MNVIKGFIIAFSMFSKIPMPFVKWEDKNQQYVFCFFPLIGLVIGALCMGWFALCQHFELNSVVFAIGSLAISFAVTGGIHLDGFMDTSDAMSSHREKERMIEILDDSHIGAFAVIKTILYFLIYFAALTCVKNMWQVGMVMVSLFGVRALAVCVLLSADNLKESGLLYTFKSNANKIITGVFTIAFLFMSMAALESINILLGVVVVVALFLCAIYFIRFVINKFGGVSGDLIGYFICISELVSVVVIGLGGVVL